MRRLILPLLLLVAACGPAQANGSTSPSAAITTPAATATATGEQLFAVLEAKIAGSPYAWNTVAIAGLDGVARATTTFVPMPVPVLGCMGPVLPLSAHVADNKVYFADGTGVVRSLASNGQVTTVASFPLGAHQQMMSFAVSPDGSRLLGTIFTVPAVPNLACNGSPGTGYSLDVYAATSGGASTRIDHESWTSAPSAVLALTGWDAVGPRGTSPTTWATQGGGPASALGVAVRVDAVSGKATGQLADPGVCLVWNIAASGDFVCTEVAVANSAGTYDEKVSVRGAGGAELWQFNLTTPDGDVYNPILAPDELRVAVGAGSETVVVGRDGSKTIPGSAAAGKQFAVTGWLDSNTVIGAMAGDPNLGYVRLGRPGTVVSLGFPGQFLGTVHS